MIQYLCSYVVFDSTNDITQIIEPPSGVVPATTKAKHYPRIPFISRTKGSKSFMQLKASVWKLPKSVVEIADELELWGHIQPRRLIYCLYLWLSH